MTKKSIPPDNIRCNRNDGRKWRCSSRVMQGKKLCEVHYLQRIKRNRKRRRQSAPEPPIKIKPNPKSLRLKLLVSFKKTKKTDNSYMFTEELLKKMKGDLHFELMRVFLKRQIEKRKQRSRRLSLFKKSLVVQQEFLLRDLPNGLMTISTLPVRDFEGYDGNTGSLCKWKLELESGDSVLRHCFRSKNLDHPLASCKAVPFGRNVAGLRRGGSANCHRCGRSDSTASVRCSGCQRQSFCKDCIRHWYSEMAGDVKMPCPVCRGTCDCKTCLSNNKSEDGEHKDLTSQKGVNKILHFHYLVCLLLPVLKQFNWDQRIELEIEGKIKGKTPTEILIQRVICESDEQLCCDNCKTFIVDFHRSCSSCSYDLCLSCCEEIRHGVPPGGLGTVFIGCTNRGKAYMHGGKPLLDVTTKDITPFQEKCVRTTLVNSVTIPDWKVNSDGNISCPPKEFGGCGNNILDLRCVLPLSWTEELEITADEIVCSYEFPEISDASGCHLCNNNRDKAGEVDRKLQEAATRKNSNDNFLYCPTREDIQGDIEHFQMHWSQGQPVIVRNVLQNKSGLSWDPLTMFQRFLGRGILTPKNNIEAVKAIDCLDWCEVEIGVQQILEGYMAGRTHPNMWPEMLKSKDWPSPKLFQEHCAAYNAEFLHSLPFPEYTNPYSGIFNLACKMPDLSKPDVGPHVYISYGIEEDLGRGDSVRKLYCDPSDVVNVLVHTAEVGIFPEQLEKIIKLKMKHKIQDESESLTSSIYENIGMAGKSENNLVTENVEGNTKNSTCLTARAPNLPDGNSGLSAVLEIPKGCGIDVKGEKMLHEEMPISNEEKLVSNFRGAQWDIFRREDVPKLQEYLRKHSNEFRHTYCAPIEHVSNAVFDQCFFLDKTHKERLKEEFKVEPWTFDQHLGEAVLIPAGCPYQIRNLKSCINVALDFMSPENVSKCIRLTDELRLLPQNHVGKLDRLEVKKMSIYGINAAVKEIHELEAMTRNGSRSKRTYITASSSLRSE